jgi:lipoprotein-anchoring transpeptidase ErfK/SrfK
MPWFCGKRHCPTHSSPEHQCRDWSLLAIAASVGAGGKNASADVRIIQAALNRVATPYQANPRFQTDGVISVAVIDAIRSFQRVAFGSASPDGRVDPGGKTFKALAGQLRLRRIMVSLGEQMLEAYEDGRLIHRFPCMTGAEDHPTEPGIFRIFTKNQVHRSRKYDAQMNYAMFFSRDGKAIHQYHGPLGLTVVRAMKRNVSDWFGSHGCVRLDEDHARKMFEWAPIDTVVQIY